jgi:membrane protein implicated in regulation of membrane protease activity
MLTAPLPLAAMTGDEILIVVGVIAAMAFLIAFAVIGQFLNLYIQAVVSGVHVSMLHLIGMRLRKVDLRTIVLTKIRLHKAGIELPIESLETHYLAGGRVVSAANALIAAEGADIRLGWDQATKMDLGGTDPFEWVQRRAGRTTQIETAEPDPEPKPPPRAKSATPLPPEQFFMQAFVGMEGAAHTALFASGVGRVKVAGKVLPAVAPNSVEIARGSPIRVTGVHPTGVLFVEPS